MRQRLLFFPILLVVFALGCATAFADSIPDPSTPGPDSVTKIEYYGGSVMMSAPAASGASTAAFQQPLDGALFYPDGPGPFDVVVLIHGNHADCLTATGSETTPSAQNCASIPGTHHCSTTRATTTWPTISPATASSSCRSTRTR